MPEPLAALEAGAPDAVLRCGACPPDGQQPAVVTFQDGSMPLCAADHRLKHSLLRLAGTDPDYLRITRLDDDGTPLAGTGAVVAAGRGSITMAIDPRAPLTEGEPNL